MRRDREENNKARACCHYRRDSASNLTWPLSQRYEQSTIPFHRHTRTSRDASSFLHYGRLFETLAREKALDGSLPDGDLYGFDIERQRRDEKFDRVGIIHQFFL